MDRKSFLKTTSLAAAGFAFPSYAMRKYQPLLSFSTLGCPDWPLEKIIAFADSHGYKGLEVRGLLRQMDLTKAPDFSTVQKRATTMARMKAHKLKFVSLGSSATLHFAGQSDRQKNMEEGKRFIDLAEEIDCPFVRVFPNLFPKDQERNETISLISDGLIALAEHAKGSKVSVLLETHGEVVAADDLLTIMNNARHKHVGLVWDFPNMWLATRASPVEVYGKLKKFIRHCHIKDAKIIEDKPAFTLLGQGEIPIFDAIDLLVRDQFKGYFSFEWEKMWHPEIAEPEVALAHFPVAFRNHLMKK